MDKTADQTVLISVHGVQQRFPVGKGYVEPLKGVDFSIIANSFNIILGPSGSGKSTLLDILSGLKAPSSGSVIVGGDDIYSLSDDQLAHYRANKVGFVHQTNNWIRSLNVIENLSVPLYCLGYSRAQAKNMAQLALSRVGMDKFADSNPALLSGGEQQRIGMARALANDPLFIIADEPTGNLDSENSSTIMKLLLNAQTELRRTVILVTHNMEYVSLADHLLRISDGYIEDINPKDNPKVIKSMLQDMTNRIREQAKLKGQTRSNHVR